MSVKKLVAIGIIYLCTSIAWMVLGGVNLGRTTQTSSALKKEVKNLFGGNVVINTPTLFYKVVEKKKVERKYFEISKTDVVLDVKLDPRKKGVLWFPTFKVGYKGYYEFKVPKDFKKDVYILATLDSSDSLYNNIKMSINNENIKNVLPLIKKEEIKIDDSKETVKLELSYNCSGMDQIMYYITPHYSEMSKINDFNFKIKTDFKNYDFPRNILSPTKKDQGKNSAELNWNLNNAITGKDIGLIIPGKINPGEIVSKVTFFAPVSLLFFFVFILVFSVINKIEFHPMNYFFMAATFFSFHLMYSYFSDHINIYVTFAIASAVSLILTCSYLRLFTPKKFAFIEIPIAQLIYLIVFSYSFFFKGMSGLIVTIAAVITLFILQQLTGKINWDEVFTKGKK